MATFSYTSPNIGDSDYPATIDTFINQVGIDLTGFSTELDSISLYINESLTDYVNGNIDHTLKNNKSFYFGTNNDFRIRNTGSSGTHISHTGAGHLFITSGTAALTMFKNSGLVYNKNFTLKDTQASLRLWNLDSGQLSTIIFLDSSGVARSYIYKVNSNGTLLLDVRASDQTTLSSLSLREDGVIYLNAPASVQCSNTLVVNSGNLNVNSGTITTLFINSSLGASIGSTLSANVISASGSTTLGGFLQVNNSATITGNLTVNGSILGGIPSADPNPTFNTLTVTNGSILNGFLTVNSTLNTTGFLSTTNSFSVSGSTTIGGFTQVNNSARITGNLTVDGTINGSSGGTDPNPTFTTITVTAGSQFNFGIFSDSVQTPVVYHASKITMQINGTDVFKIESGGTTFNKPIAIVGSDGTTLILGINNSNNTSSAAVLGIGTDKSRGVFGDTEGSGIGVLGRSIGTGTGVGVYGQSIANNAVLGQCLSANTTHSGVYGVGNYRGITGIVEPSNSPSTNSTYAGYFDNTGTFGTGIRYGLQVLSSSWGISTTVVNGSTVGNTFGILLRNTTDSSSAKGIQITMGNSSAYHVYMEGTGAGIGPFTGAHDALVDKIDTYIVGDICVDLIHIESKGYSDSIFSSSKSSYINQNNVVGVYSSLPSAMQLYNKPNALSDITDLEYQALIDIYNKCTINSVGEGSMNVCGQNGDIIAGDLIVTSDIGGKGMKQSDNIVRSHTVARARQDITFSSATEVKKIACIYLCG